MIINISEARDDIGKSQPFNFVTSANDLSLDDERPASNGLISVSGTVLNNGDAFEVSGIIELIGQYQCDRCLANYTVPLKISFLEKYREGKHDTNDSPDISYFEGNEIDICELIRESILLSQPIKKLCSENCQGLCPKCGINLNLATCTCEKGNIDPRLAVLQQFLHK